MKMIEEEVFGRCIADPEKLKQFGFIKLIKDSYRSV